MISTRHKILSGQSNQSEWVGLGMWQVQVRGEMLKGLWWGNLSDHLEDLGLDWTIILKGILRKYIDRV